MLRELPGATGKGSGHTLTPRHPDPHGKGAGGEQGESGSAESAARQGAQRGFANTVSFSRVCGVLWEQLLISWHLSAPGIFKDSPSPSPIAHVPPFSFSPFFQETFSFEHSFCSQPGCKEGLAVGRRARGSNHCWLEEPLGLLAGAMQPPWPQHPLVPEPWHCLSILGACQQQEDTHPRPGHVDSTSLHGVGGQPLPRAARIRPFADPACVCPRRLRAGLAGLNR